MDNAIPDGWCGVRPAVRDVAAGIKWGRWRATRVPALGGATAAPCRWGPIGHRNDLNSRAAWTLAGPAAEAGALSVKEPDLSHHGSGFFFLDSDQVGTWCSPVTVWACAGSIG